MNTRLGPWEVRRQPQWGFPASKRPSIWRFEPRISRYDPFAVGGLAVQMVQTGQNGLTLGEQPRWGRGGGGLIGRVCCLIEGYPTAPRRCETNLDSTVCNQQCGLNLVYWFQAGCHGQPLCFQTLCPYECDRAHADVNAAYLLVVPLCPRGVNPSRGLPCPYSDTYPQAFPMP